MIFYFVSFVNFLEWYNLFYFILCLFVVLYLFILWKLNVFCNGNLCLVIVIVCLLLFISLKYGCLLLFGFLIVYDNFLFIVVSNFLFFLI